MIFQSSLLNKRPSYSFDRKRLMKKEHENKSLTHVMRFLKILLAKSKNTIWDHISVVFCWIGGADKTCLIFFHIQVSVDIMLCGSQCHHSCFHVMYMMVYTHFFFSSILKQKSQLLIHFWWHFIHGFLKNC